MGWYLGHKSVLGQTKYVLTLSNYRYTQEYIIEGECPTAYTGLMHERVSAESHVPFYLRILVV